MTTQYINPTADEQRRWQDAGLCIACGSDTPDSAKCYCRECPECSERWLADVIAPCADTDFGPRPRVETCPECAVAGSE